MKVCVKTPVLLHAEGMYLLVCVGIDKKGKNVYVRTSVSSHCF